MFDEVGVKVTVLSMTGAKDPDEFIKKYGRERFAMLLEGSRNAVEFELAKIRSAYDVGTPDGKVGFLKEACKLFAGIKIRLSARYILPRQQMSWKSPRRQSSLRSKIWTSGNTTGRGTNKSQT